MRNESERSCITHVVTIQKSDFPAVCFVWDASLDTPGDNVWNRATANAHDWVFDGGNRSPIDASGSRLQALSKAYTFREVADRSNAGWEANGSAGLATFEFVIDVDGDNGIIFETGGSGDGIRLGMINGALRGTIAESTDVVVSNVLTADERLDQLELPINKP